MGQSCGLLCEPFNSDNEQYELTFFHNTLCIASWFFQADHHFNYTRTSVHSTPEE